MKDEAWLANPMDAFVLEKLAQNGLKPLARADKATLAGRAYLDLTGLPPGPKGLAEFLADSSPGACAALVDRLLASPRYGERWARHWLDVVRYADTAGFDANLLFESAWRYRDYVIQSFNAGKPYDLFVQEQVAGDELWPDDFDLQGGTEIPKEKLQPIAGLLADLKSRGLLESTLVIWGGEFGRTPMTDGTYKTGRDHNPYGFTIWMAGGQNNLVKRLLEG